MCASSKRTERLPWPCVGHFRLELEGEFSDIMQCEEKRPEGLQVLDLPAKPLTESFESAASKACQLISDGSHVEAVHP